MTALILFFGLAQSTTQLPLLALPEGNSAWVIQVVSTGGLLGNGGGDFAISSEGKAVCNLQLRCPTDFKPSDFQPLVEVIGTRDLHIPATPIVSLCRDCITRTMTISHRDSTGVLHTYSVSWDDTTKDKLPPQIIRIYDAVRELVK